jgi:predicted ATPase
MSVLQTESVFMHSKNSDRFFVMTGGPGSGKTAVMDALKESGVTCAAEAGRAIIQGQMSIGGRALPWADQTLFAELMLAWEMRSFAMAQQAAGPVFFDRSIVDVLGYLRLIGERIPEHMRRAAESFRYYQRVFIAPPWKEIFHTDGERKQDFDEAVRTYDAMVSMYTEYKYQLIELPRVSVEERKRFVLDSIAEPGTVFGARS